MKVAVVQKLVESYNVDQLTDAESAVLEEVALPFEIAGKDDAEILSHIMAAVWIIEKMESHDLPFPKALEAYSER